MKEGEETCQRCGDVDYDRRTLSMSCLYAMEELKLPFEQVQIYGTRVEKIGEKPLFIGNYMVPEFDSHEGKELHKYNFFTLRVCKDCRADWMGSIKKWFNNPPVVNSCGSGIYIRENGTSKEITQEEWNELIKKREEGNKL